MLMALDDGMTMVGDSQVPETGEFGWVQYINIRVYVLHYWPSKFHVLLENAWFWWETLIEVYRADSELLLEVYMFVDGCKTDNGILNKRDMFRLSLCKQ